MDKKNPFIFTLFNQIISLSPLLLAAIFYYDDYDKLPMLDNLIGNGELLIICLPTIASIILNLYFYKRKWNIWITAFLFIPNVLIMIYAVGLFSKRFNFNTPLTKNDPSVLVAWSSLGILIITTISLFFTYVIENINISADVAEVRGRQGKSLETRVNQAQEG